MRDDYLSKLFARLQSLNEWHQVSCATLWIMGVPPCLFRIPLTFMLESDLVTIELHVNSWWRSPEVHEHCWLIFIWFSYICSTLIALQSCIYFASGVSTTAVQIIFYACKRHETQAISWNLKDISVTLDDQLRQPMKTRNVYKHYSFQRLQIGWPN